jgi:hypothetical protein
VSSTIHLLRITPVCSSLRGREIAISDHTLTDSELAKALIKILKSIDVARHSLVRLGMLPRHGHCCNRTLGGI